MTGGGGRVHAKDRFGKRAKVKEMWEGGGSRRASEQRLSLTLRMYKRKDGGRRKCRCGRGMAREGEKRIGRERGLGGVLVGL